MNILWSKTLLKIHEHLRFSVFIEVATTVVERYGTKSLVNLDSDVKMTIRTREYPTRKE